MVIDLHQEAQRRGEDFSDELRLSILSMNKPESMADTMRVLWPDMFTKEVQDEDETVEALDSEEGVEWQFDKPMDPGEVDRMFSHILSSPGGDLGVEVPDEENEWV